MAKVTAQTLTTITWKAGDRLESIKDKMQAGTAHTALAMAMAEYKMLKSYAAAAGYMDKDEEGNSRISVEAPVYSLSIKDVDEHYKDAKKVIKATMSYQPAKGKKSAQIVVKRDIVKLVVDVDSTTYSKSMGEAGTLVIDTYAWEHDQKYAETSRDAFETWAGALGLTGQKVAKSIIKLARKAVKACNGLREGLEAVYMEDGYLPEIDGLAIKLEGVELEAQAGD